MPRVRLRARNLIAVLRRRSQSAVHQVVQAVAIDALAAVVALVALPVRLGQVGRGDSAGLRDGRLIAVVTAVVAVVTTTLAVLPAAASVRPGTPSSAPLRQPSVVLPAATALPARAAAPGPARLVWATRFATRPITRPLAASRSALRSALGFVFPFADPASVQSPGAWTRDDGVDVNALGDACGSAAVLVAVGNATVVQEGIPGFGPSAPVLSMSSGPLVGRYVYYGHTGPDLVPVGAYVHAGQPISEVGCGSVGYSFGPHLEIGVSLPGGSTCCPPFQATSQLMYQLLVQAYEH
ncbi:MAG TPA: hypothetical protein VNG13_15475 [Mycobacteriales bacterium]|nr:hypothetical protein [Mycobacteriales bacterium]